MVDSLLDKISVSSNNIYITDRWLNGLTGAIIDLTNDYSYRFIDYITNGDSIRQKYLTEEGKLSCPIVACGIVGFWLKHKDKQSIKSLFNNYYNLCQKQYESSHENEPDAWKRNLQLEFASKFHIRKEKQLIKQSEAIFPFLTESDRKRILDTTSNYLQFARAKRKEASPNHYAPERVIEETFFAAYSLGGAAYECVEWFRDEYDMHIMGPHNFSDGSSKRKLEGKWKTLHDIEMPEYILEEYEDFNDSVLTYSNGGMMDEIHANLERCHTSDDRFRYISSLLQPFRDFAEAFCPLGSIHEREEAITRMQKSITSWQSVPVDTIDPNTGKLLNPKAQIQACLDFIDKYQKDIIYWKKLERKFYDFAQQGLNQKFEESYNHAMCKCLGYWWSLMITFSRRLAALALTYGIKLMDVQEHCQIYLNWHFTITDYVDDKYISTFEQAQQLLDKIDSFKPQSPVSDYHNILDIIYSGYTNLEKLPPIGEALGEVPLRNYIAVHLQTIGYNATAETFNRSGKTDICIKKGNGNNIFIAECKIWRGVKQFHAAIDQLFGYLTWNDRHTALILFVENGNFTKTINLAANAITQHRLFVKAVDNSHSQNNRKSYIFRHSSDPKIMIELELMLFHFPKVSNKKLINNIAAESIKAQVIDWLIARYQDIIIGNEVMYGTSRKVVDLLAIIGNKTIAIEIKSASDKLTRLSEQLQEYNKVFDKVMIISSPSHIKSIMRIIPDGTGLYSIDKHIRRVQAATTNRHLDKIEMLNSISSIFLKKHYPQHKTLKEKEIRLLLSKEKKAEIHQLLISFYKQRLTEKFLLFMSDRGSQTLVDDIPVLSSLTLIDEA